MWKALFHIPCLASSHRLSCNLSWFASACTRGRQKLVNAKDVALLLKPAEAECHWYDQPSPPVVNNTCLTFLECSKGQISRSYNSPWQITEPRSGRVERKQLLQNKGIVGRKKPTQTERGEICWWLAPPFSWAEASKALLTATALSQLVTYFKYTIPKHCNSTLMQSKSLDLWGEEWIGLLTNASLKK